MGNKTCYAAKFTSSGGNHNNQYMFTTPASLLHCQGRQAMKLRQNAIGTFYVNHTFYCVIRCLNSVFPLGAFMWRGFCRRLRWYMFIWDTPCQSVHTGLYAGPNYCQSHVLVDTWMSTVKPVYKLLNDDDLKWTTITYVTPFSLTFKA